MIIFRDARRPCETLAMESSQFCTQGKKDSTCRDTHYMYRLLWNLDSLCVCFWTQEYNLNARTPLFYLSIVLPIQYPSSWNLPPPLTPSIPRNLNGNQPSNISICERLHTSGVRYDRFQSRPFSLNLEPPLDKDSADVIPYHMAHACDVSSTLSFR